MTKTPPLLSYESPGTDKTPRRLKLARLIFLADALIFLGLGLMGAAAVIIPQILEVRAHPGFPPTRMSAANLSTFLLVCSLGPALIGALFLFSFAKLGTNTPLAATIVRRCAFGIMPALIALIILISFILIKALFSGMRTPTLAGNLLTLGICAAGIALLGFTAWIAGRVRNDDARHRPPTT
jgi:hypothetical protein